MPTIEGGRPARSRPAPAKREGGIDSRYTSFLAALDKDEGRGFLVEENRFDL